MNARRWRLVPWLVLVLACLPQGIVQAHLLNMTKVQVTLRPDGEVEVDLQIDLSRSAGGGEAYYQFSRIADPLTNASLRPLLDRLAAAISLQVGEQTIALAVRKAALPTVGHEVFLDPLSWPMTQVVLGGHWPAGLARRGTALQATFLPGFHFEEPIALTLVDGTDGRSMTRWLVTSQTSPTFLLGSAGNAPATDAAGTSGWRFIGFGFLHILPKGLDHVLFVLGIYLGSRSLRSLLLLVTCFTLAHSITLGLASVGLVRLPSGIVEPLISLSIVWIGIENLFAASQAWRHRAVLVFAFGLLHGLGFASALSGLDAPPGRFLLSLLDFNVGIELAQLAVIAAALAVTGWWRHKPWFPRRVVAPASLLIALVAAFWTAERLL